MTEIRIVPGDWARIWVGSGFWASTGGGVWVWDWDWATINNNV